MGVHKKQCNTIFWRDCMSLKDQVVGKCLTTKFSGQKTKICARQTFWVAEMAKGGGVEAGEWPGVTVELGMELGVGD